MKIILLIVVLAVGCGSDDKGASPGDSTPVTPQVVVVPEREQDARLAQIELPPGFAIHLYAEGLSAGAGFGCGAVVRPNPRGGV